MIFRAHCLGCVQVRNSVPSSPASAPHGYGTHEVHVADNQFQATENSEPESMYAHALKYNLRGFVLFHAQWIVQFSCPGYYDRHLGSYLELERFLDIDVSIRQSEMNSNPQTRNKFSFHLTCLSLFT